MMWLLYGFISAFLLGLYDVAKKHALTGNAVLPVLFLNTLLSSLLFLPLFFLSGNGVLPEESLLYLPDGNAEDHLRILLKSLIVLLSWIFGYFAIKHLPITITGPITATRPVMVLAGALLFFGEQLNGWQWAGILLSFVSLLLLSRTGKKEGIDFRNNRWIWFIFLAALLGAVSALYDKYLLRQYHHMFVQAWFTFYQLFLMGPVLLILWYPQRRKSTRFSWRWSILLISLFLCAADFVYFYALTFEESLISVLSMVRRSSVIVSFGFGVLFFRERNIRRKAADLLLILLGMLFLYWGSR